MPPRRWFFMLLALVTLGAGCRAQAGSERTSEPDAAHAPASSSVSPSPGETIAAGAAPQRVAQGIAVRHYGRYRIVDGAVVEGANGAPVDFGRSRGMEAELPGRAMALFPSPVDDRLTVLFTAASTNETSKATLLSTVDGGIWEPVGEEYWRMFDSSTISGVIEGGDGLLAVGASPGGEFVPTAAVFTSHDGIEWLRVTPETAEFRNGFMNDVVDTPEGFVAVGGDFFETGLMTAWTSADGRTWHRSESPNESIDPATAHMAAESVHWDGEGLTALGFDYDAARIPERIDAEWRSTDGGSTWERIEPG